MKSLSGPIWDRWNAGGPFLGVDKPNGYVTVEFGWVLRVSDGPVGTRDPNKLPIRWWQRADNSQEETILPNVTSLNWERSVDTDAATADIEMYNQQMLPAQLAELGNPGYFTFGRGDHPDSLARWGHMPNEWTVEMTPNALLRSYEGYGGYNDDGTQMDLADAIAGGFVTQTGVWLIDELRPQTDAILRIKCRDSAKLLVDQPLYPPLVPGGFYPVQYARFYWRHVSTPYVAYGTAAGGVKIIVGLVADAGNDGYWLYGDDGGVFTYGDNYFHGSLSGDLDHQGIGMARSFADEGYWLAVKAGDVYAFGDATWFGGHAPALGEEMVAIESCENGDGYYLCDTAGDVYSFGAAVYHGGGPGSSPIVGMAVKPDGTGYWLLDDTGHVYTYGTAAYLGGGDPAVGSPYTTIESSETGDGYWLATKRGHVYAFGDAEYHGGTQYLVLNDPISDMVRRPDGVGYWLVAEDGGVFTFGDIPFYGSLPGASENDFPYDGNYFDYTDIIKDLLLWAGFWLYPGVETDGSPTVYGSLESTGAYGPERLPMDMFDRKQPMEAINQLKEIVGFITWVDSEGAFHWESPNWWNLGNNLPDGSRTDVLPEIDERLQLINYGVSADDKTARDRVIITDADPTQNIPGSHTTIVELTPNVLRGLVKPAMWQNGILTSVAEQQKMAELLGRQIKFLQRVGSVVCWANPMLEVNDQCRIWERITDEVNDHYIRGIASDHNFETGEYTMRVTTHWLGRDWGGRGPDRNVLAGSVRSSEGFGLPRLFQPINMRGDNLAGPFGLPPQVGAQSAAIAGVTTAAAFGQPLIRQQITPAGVAPGAPGTPTVVGPQVRDLAGLTSSGAFGLPTVDVVEAALFVDDFADLSAWSAGGFSITPAGFAYHGGDGVGSGGATHAEESTAEYVEALCYGDATSGDNWGVIKLDNAGGAAYDGNGFGVAFRSTTGDVFPIVASATLSWTDGDWPLPGTAFNLGTNPRSLATAVLIGIHRVSAGVYDIYINRVRKAQYTAVTGATGTNVYMGAYNGMGMHVDYVATAAMVLTGDPR